jgi:hypothetical protein
MISCSFPDPAEQEALRVWDAIAPHSRAAQMPVLVARAEPMAKEFSWTFQVDVDWRDYTDSLAQRLPDYRIVGSGESWRDFVRLLPGDEYELRVERLNSPSGPVAVARFDARPR